MNKQLQKYLQQCPVIAILRGVKPHECIEIAEALFSAGIRVIEVPLNSPDPFTSIGRLAQHFGDSALIGAGTVLSEEQVEKVRSVGGKIIISPNMNPEVGKKALDLDMIWTPGVFTPSEAFLALEHKAHGLKIFPADMASPALVKAWLATMPENTTIIPVGGVHSKNAADYLNAGASGLGVGGSVYRPGDSASKTREKADLILNAI